jgi:flagellar biosynthetic protein FliR
VIIDSGTLAAFFSNAVFGALCLFARVAAATALLPGIGEVFIPQRVKLAVALAISLAFWPLARQYQGAMPDTIPSIAFIVMAEIGAGLLFGLWLRLLVMALQMAGAIIGQQLSLSALFAGPTAPDPETTFATLLTLGGITLLLASGLHLQVITALLRSYEILPWGFARPAEDAATTLIDRGALALKLGLQLAAPFVVASFIYNLCLGAMNRAMPQLLVSLIGAPALVAGGLFMLAVGFPLLLSVWSGAVQSLLLSLL